MPTKFKALAIAAALAAGTSSAAMAQYACPSGYTYYNGVCQPAAPGYGNPVTGTVSGEAAGAANGAATGGPVGAALGAAGGALSGTANMLTGSSTPPVAPACAAGYYFYNGYCYPRR